MSDARSAFPAGRLSESLGLQRSVVERIPADESERRFLFELLFLAGQLDEAQQHVEVVRPAQRDCLAVERRRIPKLRRPEFLAPPPRHLRCRWNATLCHRRGRNAQSEFWLDRADALVPEVSGFVDGREFRGLRDADDRFATLLECAIGDKYFWIPFEEVRILRLRAYDGEPLDIAYRPARLETVDRRTFEVRLPLIYPGSGSAGDELALGELVDWIDAGAGPICGLGARIYSFGDEELDLGSCGTIEIRPV